MLRARIGFYSDDATGGADAMAQCAHEGLRTVLLFRVPDESQVSQLGQNYDAIGISGLARAMPRTRISEEISSALDALWLLGPEVVQYKVCSTFDSAPDRGNIMVAIDQLRQRAGQGAVIVAPAQPVLGRFTVFSNHFARDGSAVFRLDRHPTMCSHPSTPMDEADLRVVLERQAVGRGTRAVDAVQLPTVQAGSDAIVAAVRSASSRGAVAVVVDALDDIHLDAIAAAVMQYRELGRPGVVVGSGGIASALGRALGGDVGPAVQGALAPVGPVRQMLVVVGSAAAATAQQVAACVERGWASVDVSLEAFASDPDASAANVRQAIDTYLARGLSVVARTVAERDTVVDSGLTAVLGSFFGRIVEGSLRERRVGRALIAGGDTSSFAVRSMSAWGAEVRSTAFSSAAPLCVLRSEDRELDGAELMLKGGQIGSRGLFEHVRLGQPVVEVV